MPRFFSIAWCVGCGGSLHLLHPCRCSGTPGHARSLMSPFTCGRSFKVETSGRPDQKNRGETWEQPVHNDPKIPKLAVLEDGLLDVISDQIFHVRSCCSFTSGLPVISCIIPIRRFSATKGLESSPRRGWHQRVLPMALRLKAPQRGHVRSN